MVAQWTPEEIDQTVALAQANFAEGADKVKRTVMAVYERKKKLRLEKGLKQVSERHGAGETQRHSIYDHFS